MKQNILSKTLSFLRAKPIIGGLEIADSALRFVVLDGGEFRMSGLRLPPGVVVGGQLKDRAKFIEAAILLHDQILGPKKRKNRISSIVSLSSIGIYTQVFTLPFIEGSSLEKAVQLNIQMISPLDFSEAYSGWQFANKDTDKVRLEILSAFANKGIVDEFAKALEEGGFLAVAVESRALSLTRLLKESGMNFSKERTYVVMSVDESGLDFLIIRHGQLHFDYFNSWGDLQGDAKEISAEAFQGAVVRNLHQVLNFYNSHWQEPLDEIILSATGFREDVARIIGENFSLTVADMALSGTQSLAPDWFVSLGAAMRGLVPRGKDQEISLLGIDAQEEFGREQILGFLRFWKVLMPLAVGIFVVAFVGTYVSLAGMDEDLTSHGSLAGGTAVDEARQLESQIGEFNRKVDLLRAAESGSSTKTPLIEKVMEYAGANGVTVTRLTYQAPGYPLSLIGTTKSQDALLAFKKSMEADTLFSGVSLPLTNVKITASGVEFSMTFSENPSRPK